MKLNQFLPESVTINGVGEKAAQYYTDVSNHLIKELRIPKTTKVIVHVNSNHGLDKTQNGSTLPDLKRPNIIHVYLLPGLDRATLLRALCHEFVHVQQMASGRLVLRIEDKKLAGMEWEGQEVKNPNYNRNSEWELEAHIKEKDLLQNVIQNVGNLIL